MARRLALAALTLSSTLIVVFCLVGGDTAEIGFAALAVAFPALLMILGAADRGGGLRSIAWPVALLLLVLEACLYGLIELGGRGDTGAWLLGLPAASAIQLYGLFLLPLAIVALGYALTFESFGVSDDELARLRDRAADEDNG